MGKKERSQANNRFDSNVVHLYLFRNDMYKERKEVSYYDFNKKEGQREKRNKNSFFQNDSKDFLSESNFL